MLKDSFEGKIIRVDGFDNEEVTCKVFMNDKLQEEFSAVSHQRSIQLCGKGTYRFEFSSVSIKKSVSLKLSLFTDDGAQWLPLFDSDDLIEDLPEETSSPRFLIVLCKSKTLQVIEESGEISEESSLTVSESEDLMPEVKLCSDFENQILNTQEFIESIDSDFLDQSSIHEENSENNGIANSEKLNRIWEPDNSVFNESQDRNSFEIIKENQGLRGAVEEISLKFQQVCKLHEEELKRSTEKDEKIAKMLENYKEQIKRSQDREESLLELVAEKENEVKVAQDEIFQLRSDLKRCQIENARLKDVNDGLTTEFSVLAQNPYQSELAHLKGTLVELQSLLAKSNTIQYEQKLSEKDILIQVLQQQLHRLRPYDSDTKESQNSSISIFDELDESVRYHAKTMNLPEPLIKDKEQMYMYGHRKLSLILQNGNLMCRIGGSFRPFKEYMENFVLESNAIRPLKKRFSMDQNIDSEYDADKFRDAINKSRTSQRGLRHAMVKRKTKN